jgi:cytoskeletal protein CcmA (bactofilin family)
MQQKETKMFGQSKNGQVGKNGDPAPVQQLQRPTIGPAATTDSPELISCISSGVTVVGKIIGDGTFKIFGRLEGELQASTVVIADGGQVLGEVVADDLTVGGRVKGTIHANRVKLHSTAIVEGDIFHRSLSIEQEARFEGSSRREEVRFEGSSRRDEDVVDKPSSGQVPRLKAEPQTHVTAFDGSQKLNGQPNNEAQANPATV